MQDITLEGFSFLKEKVSHHSLQLYSSCKALVEEAT